MKFPDGIAFRLSGVVAGSWAMALIANPRHAPIKSTTAFLDFNSRPLNSGAVTKQERQLSQRPSFKLLEKSFCEGLESTKIGHRWLFNNGLTQLLLLANTSGLPSM